MSPFHALFFTPFSIYLALISFSFCSCLTRCYLYCGVKFSSGVGIERREAFTVESCDGKWPNLCRAASFCWLLCRQRETYR